MDNVIRKRPWTIIAIWLIIVIISGPLATSINDIVKTSEEEFLPSTAESIRADNEMAKLRTGNKTVEVPGYMLVVSNIPVDLETYHRLRPWYDELKNEYKNVTFSSWIDITESVEDQARTGLATGLNMSIQAVKGLISTSQAYNKMLKGINQTAGLLEGADRAYTGYWEAGTGLHAGLPIVNNIASSMNLSCNIFLPTIMKTYFDIVRSEALLEKLTDAYTNPPIDNADIVTVIAASNITGVGPVNASLVYIVYNKTLSAGGPSNFNNTFAADLASDLAWKVLEEAGTPSQVKPFYQIAAQTWMLSVADMQDHRLYITNAPNVVTGQLMLLSELNTAAQNLKPLVGRQVGDVVLSRLPPEAFEPGNYTVNTIIESNCTVDVGTIGKALTKFLIDKGVNPIIANKIVNDVLADTFTKEKAAEYAAEIILEYASMQGVQLPSQFKDLIKQTLLVYDANASGTLLGVQSYGVAAILSLETAKITLSEEEREQLLQAQSLEEAAYNATKIMLEEMAGPQASSLLDLLAQANLLGKSNEEILDKAPKILSKVMAQEGHNITKEDAEEMLEYAVKVYVGELEFNQALDELVNETLSKAFSEIIKEIKGVLIEKDEKGFLIGLSLPGDSLEEKTELAVKIKEKVVKGLEASGYNNGEVLLGGSEYMSYTIRESAQQDIERSDRLSMLFVIIVLAIIMESIAAVFLPFIGIGFGLIVSLALAYILGKYGVIDVTTHSRTIMFTTGLGLGIDYAAYVSRRFREAAAKGLNSREAAVEAYRKALRPVLAGATTAMIGFGSMMLAWDFPFVSSIGSNVPLTIFAVMIASITFIPALLAYVGETRWFWWPRHPVETSKKEPRFKGVGRFIAHKAAVPLAIALLLAVFAGVVMTGFTGSYDFAINLPKDSEARKALEYINTNYDAGVLYPAYIVASSKEEAQQIQKGITSLSCVAKAEVLHDYRDRVVRVVMNVYPMSKEGVDCVEQLRKEAHSIDPGSLVGGMAAVNLDLRNLINDRFYHRVYPVALTLMFLTFLAAYGGVITALSAIFAVVIAAYAGSALTIILYQDYLGMEVMWYLPVIVFTAILGVGMDYNSFYIARAREECMRECTREAVVDSIALGTPTVLGLATIMAGAYVGLALATSPGLSMMGTALVFGVILAGINASLILTPPLIALLGKASWWPRYPRGAVSE